MKIRRYYARYVDGAWRIFDRDFLTQQGEAIAVAECISKNVAEKIRTALNDVEEAFTMENSR